MSRAGRFANCVTAFLYACCVYNSCQCCWDQLYVSSCPCTYIHTCIHTYIHAYIGNTLFILNTHFADNGKYASKLQTYDVIVDGLHTVGAIRCHVMYFGRRTN